MQNMVSLREYSDPLCHPCLRTIWYVDADRTYCVTRRNTEESFFVAIRTLAGAGRLELRDGRNYVLKADSLLLLDWRQILNYATDEDRWQFYWFEFEGIALDASLLGQAVSLPVTAREQQMLERSFRSLNRNNIWECTLAEASFSCLLADWLLRREQTEEKGLPVSELLELLETGRRERTGIAALARQAGMCERSFRDAVRKATGLSPKTYMLRGEMTAAMELLKTSNMTVSEISGLLQYKNPFYFSRVFKQYHGFPPQQVREEKLSERRE